MLPINPLPRWAIEAIAALLLLIAGWAAMHFYGVHRYNEGASAEDAKWQAASAKLQQDAGTAAAHADANSAASSATHAVQQQADQAAVNKAQAEGRSPLDALFAN